MQQYKEHSSNEMTAVNILFHYVIQGTKFFFCLPVLWHLEHAVTSSNNIFSTFTLLKSSSKSLNSGQRFWM